jgi:hypothetical protein
MEEALVSLWTVQTPQYFLKWTKIQRVLIFIDNYQNNFQIQKLLLLSQLIGKKVHLKLINLKMEQI